MKAPQSNTQSNFEILSAGTHRAVCSQIIGIGYQPTEWQGVTTDKAKLKLRFEVPDERVEWETSEGEEREGPKIIWLTCNFSMHENANLRKHIQSWLGQKIPDREAYEFDVNQMLGRSCLINVVHREWQGKTYANIESIAPLMKGMEKPEIEGPSFTFDPYDHTDAEFDKLPDWLQNLVNIGTNREEKLAQQGFRDKPTANKDDFTDDDIPF